MMPCYVDLFLIFCNYNRMEDSIASTLSEAITWIATETMTAIEGIPTDQVDMPLEPPIGGDEMGPDSSEGSYFLARLFPLNPHSLIRELIFRTH